MSVLPVTYETLACDCPRRDVNTLAGFYVELLDAAPFAIEKFESTM